MRGEGFEPERSAASRGDDVRFVIAHGVLDAEHAIVHAPVSELCSGQIIASECN